MPKRRKMSARLMFKGLHGIKYLVGEKAVSLKQIVTNPYQPTINRSTLEKIEDLYNTICNSRYISAIDVVEIPNTPAAREAWEMTLEEYPTHDPAGKEITYYVLLNGHRRYTVAKELGLKAVDVAVVNLSDTDRSNPAKMIECFMQRQSSMTVTGAQQFAIWSKAKSNKEREALLAALTPKVKGAIEAFVEYMGLEYAIKKGATGELNPLIAKDAQSFVNMCVNKGHKDAIAKTGLDISNDALKDIAIKKILLWVMECETKRTVDDVMRHHKSNESIVIDIFTAAKRMVSCKLQERIDGTSVIVFSPKKTATRKEDMPVNTANMATLFTD